MAVPIGQKSIALKKSYKNNKTLDTGNDLAICDSLRKQKRNIIAQYIHETFKKKTVSANIYKVSQFIISVYSSRLRTPQQENVSFSKYRVITLKKISYFFNILKAALSNY